MENYSQTRSFNYGIAKELSVEAALIYDELAFLNSKGSRDDGWIWKTDQELVDRMPFSLRTVKRAKQQLIDAGYVETKIMKVSGVPTTHYRVKKWLNPLGQNGTLESAKMALSIESAKMAQTSIRTTHNINSLTSVLPTTTETEKIYEQFVKRFGFAPTKSKKANLNSIDRILEKNRVTAVELVGFMQYAASIQGEQYAPSIDNFWDIEDKWPDIARYKARSEKSTGMVLDLDS